MKRKSFTLLLTIISASILFAQTKVESEAKVEKHQFVYNVLTNITYEKSLGSKTTLHFSGPISTGFSYMKSSITIYDYHEKKSEWGYSIRPNLDMEIRHYYDLNKRLKKGKKIAHNSGNYVAGVVGAAGPAILKTNNVSDYTFTLGTMWGIQRNYGERFMMNIGIGPGVNFYDSFTEFTPLVGLSFGFRLGK